MSVTRQGGRAVLLNIVQFTGQLPPVNNDLATNVLGLKKPYSQLKRVRGT